MNLSSIQKELQDYADDYKKLADYCVDRKMAASAAYFYSIEIALSCASSLVKVAITTEENEKKSVS